MGYSSSDGVFAVRLARAACERFAAEPEAVFDGLDGAPEALRAAGGSFVTLRRAKDNDLRGCIYKKSTVSQIRDAAIRGGMISLMQDGIQKTLKGFTDLNEIRSVCSK